jgi:alpha-tubulin suppressor-like RCC1 family protein
LLLEVRQCSVVLTAGADVFTFGYGSKGQLGHDGLRHELSPRKVETWQSWQYKRVANVAAGLFHTALLTDQGVVLTFGDNRLNELGRTIGPPAPLAGEFNAYRLRRFQMPCEVELDALAGESAVELIAGWERTGVVTASGRLVTFGRDEEASGTVREHVPE